MWRGLSPAEPRSPATLVIAEENLFIGLRFPRPNSAKETMLRMPLGVGGSSLVLPVVDPVCVSSGFYVIRNVHKTSQRHISSGVLESNAQTAQCYALRLTRPVCSQGKDTRSHPLDESVRPIRNLPCCNFFVRRPVFNLTPTPVTQWDIKQQPVRPVYCSAIAVSLL